MAWCGLDVCILGILHGLALVVHRFWKQFGLTMPKALAWLITFNFVNIAWVFFRAKEWDDAIQILRGMAGLRGITLPEKLAIKFSYLEQYGVNFGTVFANVGMSHTKDILLLVFILIIATSSKNSIQWSKTLKPTLKFQLLIIIQLVIGILSLSNVSEFLYFQF